MTTLCKMTPVKRPSWVWSVLFILAFFFKNWCKPEWKLKCEKKKKFESEMWLPCKSPKLSRAAKLLEDKFMCNLEAPHWFGKVHRRSPLGWFDCVSIYCKPWWVRFSKHFLSSPICLQMSLKSWTKYTFKIAADIFLFLEIFAFALHSLKSKSVNIIF